VRQRQQLNRRSGVRLGERNPSGSPHRSPAPSVYLGFTRNMHRMFNGAPVVTHEPAAFVEVLEGNAFSDNCLATEMLRNAEICLTLATSRIYQRGEQFLNPVRPVVSDV
jgi:hypothetical protein